MALAQQHRMASARAAPRSVAPKMPTAARRGLLRSANRDVSAAASKVRSSSSRADLGLMPREYAHCSVTVTVHITTRARSRGAGAQAVVILLWDPTTLDAV
jgi:hypothetical protein